LKQKKVEADKQQEAKKGKEQMVKMGLTDEYIDSVEITDKKQLLKCKICFRLRF
jgi:hypothetical protein